MSPNLIYTETSVIFTPLIDQLLKDKDTDLQDQHSVTAFLNKWIVRKNGELSSSDRKLELCTF